MILKNLLNIISNATKKLKLINLQIVIILLQKTETIKKENDCGNDFYNRIYVFECPLNAIKYFEEFLTLAKYYFVL